MIKHDLDYYRKIQGLNDAETRKEADIRLIQAEIARDFENTLDCEDVEINGTSAKVLITKTQDNNIKKIVSQPSSPIYLGDMVEWLNSYWLIDDMDADNRITTKGKMRRCNIILNWIDSSGTIISKYGCCEDATRFSEGVTSGSQISVGDFNLKVKLPKDSDTIKLQRDMRFLLDSTEYMSQIMSSGSHPLAFKLSKKNSITGNLSGEGIIELMISEDEYSDKLDNPYRMVANYYSKDDSYSVGITNATSPLRIAVGADYTLAATVSKNGIEDDEISIWFYSSDESIATVSQTGKITAVAEGTCIITAQVADSKQQIDVTVYSEDESETAEIVISPQGGATSIPYGETLRIDLKAFENGAETSATFTCAIDDGLLDLAEITTEEDGYIIIAATDNADNVGEEFVLNVSCADPSASSSMTLRIRGWM